MGKLEGKSAGDAFSVSLEPADAFGDYDENLIRIEPREVFPGDLQVGMQFEGVPQGEEDDREREGHGEDRQRPERAVVLLEAREQDVRGERQHRAKRRAPRTRFPAQRLSTYRIMRARIAGSGSRP